jgi:pimeloyl-ACP methyl ester carboxylesterase
MQAASGRRFYMHYFQEPGIADAQMNADIYKTLRGSFYSVSGSASDEERWRVSVGDGETILDTFVDPEQLPAWLSEQALDYYVSEYERHGFTPPLNYYRNLDRNWELTPFLDGLRPSLPSFFIGGADDPSNEFNKPAFDTLEDTLPDLRGKVVLEGVGHDCPEEKPEELNRNLLEFLAGL